MQFSFPKRRSLRELQPYHTGLLASLLLLRLRTLGGLRVLSRPEEAAEYADAIVIGDRVQTWPLILRDIEQATLKSRYAAMYEND